jgi:Family of unknown function (DUF6152)
MTIHSSILLALRDAGRCTGLWRNACCAAVLLATCPPVFAHHSFAMFDSSKETSVQGTVKEFQWTNPHSFIELMTSNDTGGTDLWSIELNSPNNLKRQGWKSTSIKPGDKVTLVFNRLRDGGKGGLFIMVTLPDGTVLGDPTRRGPPASAPIAK